MSIETLMPIMALRDVPNAQRFQSIQMMETFARGNPAFGFFAATQMAEEIKNLDKSAYARGVADEMARYEILLKEKMQEAFEAGLAQGLKDAQAPDTPDDAGDPCVTEHSAEERPSSNAKSAKEKA